MESAFTFYPDSKSIYKIKKVKSSAVPYPIFRKLAKHVDDPWWADFFQDISVNFPKGLGFSFYQDCIYYQISNKGKYKCPIDADPEIAIPMVIEFFKTHGSLCPPDSGELSDSSTKENKNAGSTQRKWRSFSSFEKERAIDGYIDLKVEEYNLTSEEISDLRYVLVNGIEMGEIKSSRILLRGQEIIDITGISFDEEDRSFDFHLTTKRATKTPNRQTTDPLIKSWINVLQKLEKYSPKSEKKKKS